MIGLKCPTCGFELEIGSLVAGQPITCPKCRQAVLVGSGSRPIELPTRRADPPSTDGSPGTETLLGRPDISGRPSVKSFDFLSPPRGADGIGWLGSYRIVKLLGAGGMGIVFLAEDSHLQRLVALKVVRPEQAADPELRKRFLREARAMASVKSDHIVAVYQVGEENSLPFLAMEYLEGENLEERLARDHRPDFAFALRVVRESALGLAAAHQRGLVHRDIKPGNIFIESPSGRVKILDFGLAHSVDTPSNLTAPGLVMGTPEYMSPEQAEAAEVTERSDLFSLGSVLYRLLSGKKPFGEGNTMAVLKAVMMNEPLSIHIVNPAVPPALSDLTSRLLAKKPAQRPESAQAVADALEKIARDIPASSPMSSHSQPMLVAVRPSASPAIRRRVVLTLGLAAAGLLVGCLLLAGVLLWGFGGTGKSSEQAGSSGSGGSSPKGSPPGGIIKAGTGSIPVITAHTINGSGSTFVYPLMQKWGVVYRKEKALTINYLSTGSGAGVKQFLSGGLDFCCSDFILTDEELQQARKAGGEVIHVPLALGAVVPAYNLPGLEKPLRFSGPVLADIFLGEIKKWNDPALQEINPGVDLPDLDIAVVHRASSSGTTFIFTDFLSKVSKDWQKKFGASASVKWPVGIKVAGSAGMAEMVGKTLGSIGYMELVYALQSRLKFGLVKNREGAYVQGSLESTTATAEHLSKDMPDDLRFSLTYGPGKNAYPICGCTWAIIYARQHEGSGQRLVEFLRWATQDGQEYSTDLFYARLPASLIERVTQRLNEVKFGE
jgi:eukaryotic-like serine/threonine-protein kinase